jgi:hypothetical protein
MRNPGAVAAGVSEVLNFFPLPSRKLTAPTDHHGSGVAPPKAGGFGLWQRCHQAAVLLAATGAQ